VTFQVNMSVQVALGSFDPASSTVRSPGSSTVGVPLTSCSREASLIRTSGWHPHVDRRGRQHGQLLVVMNAGPGKETVGPGGAQNRALDPTAQRKACRSLLQQRDGRPGNHPHHLFRFNWGQIDQGNSIRLRARVRRGDLLNNWNTSASVAGRGAQRDLNLWTGTFEVNSSAGR